MDWKEFEGKLLHVVVENVYSYRYEEDEVTIKILETDGRVAFRVYTEEDK